MKDENWLKTQFPFPLVRTNMEGVYTIPPLPDDLDLKTASDATLWQHGLLLRRPGPGDHPAIVAAWNQIYERGLRIIAPHLEPLPPTGRRIIRRMPHPGPPGGGQATLSNLCGGALEGSGGWSSVTGTLNLPYLSVPAQGLQGKQPAGLAAWVGLDGLGPVGPGSGTVPSDFFELLQAVITFNLDMTTNPPSTDFQASWLWLGPDPNDPYAMIPVAGAGITNARMKSGDLVSLSCDYFRANDGSNWGAVSFLFLNDVTRIPITTHGGPALSVEVPLLISGFAPGPPSVSGQGGSIEWILENLATTAATPNTIVPVFSASKNSITPITFTAAGGFGQPGVTGDPENGFTILWAIDNVASVALAPKTVSITYTGP
ncbi:MAG: G1 family glutamic endopeptidase [Candidatus Binataceae bacterium]